MRIPRLCAHAVLVLVVGWKVSAAAQEPATRENASLAPPYARIVEGEAVPVTAHPDPGSLLHNEDPRLAANKRLVWDMWRTLVNAGHAEAVDRFLAEDFRQYDPTINNGREAFRKHISEHVERRDRVPDAITDPVVTLLAEGDFVVLALVNQYPEADGSGDTYTSTRFDIFQIEDDRIVAHWDSVQIPEGMNPPPPERGGPLPVAGKQGLDQLELLKNEDQALANNKRLVFDVWRQIPEAGREELADLYLDPLYIQHNPNATTGRAGFKEYFARRPDSPIETYLEDPLITMVAEGDLVVQAVQEERPHPVTGETYYVAWIDMFRVSEGRLIEHWDTASKGELPASMQQP